MLCAVILEALRMRHTPNVLCKLCMTGITTALLQVQLLAAQARRSLHFPQLDSLLHELDELGSLHYLQRSFFIRHSSHVVRSSYTFARRILPLVVACRTLPLVVRCRTDNIRSWTSWPWTATPCGYFYGYTLHTLHELIAHGLKE